MIKSLPLVIVLFCAACGSASPSADSLAGHWRGSVPWTASANRQVDATVTPSGTPDYFIGTLTTDDPRCFTHAPLVASFIQGSLQLQANGAGTATQFAAITITGEADVDTNKIVGLFSMLSDLADCAVDATSFVLERQ
jgi:hypothetical protein